MCPPAIGWQIYPGCTRDTISLPCLDLKDIPGPIIINLASTQGEVFFTRLCSLNNYRSNHSSLLYVVGEWRSGFQSNHVDYDQHGTGSRPGSLDQRMKIEICFRDLKSLLHIDKVMNKSEEYQNKMLAMVILAYAICLVVGETIRDVQYAQVVPDELNLLKVPLVEKRSRWFLFSGPFLLLKHRYRLGRKILILVVKAALLFFAKLVFANVRTLVRT